MSRRGLGPDAVELSGLDGANPLGFLAALGTLVTLHGAGEKDARLWWRRGATWIPAIDGVATADPEGLSELVARELQGCEVAPKAEHKRMEAERRFKNAKRAVNQKQTDIRKRGLRRPERQAAIEAEVVPLQCEYGRAREAWLQALSAVVHRAELALGQRIDCTPDEYRQHAEALLAQSALANRDPVDLLAAFGGDACLNQRTGTIEPTPFQFITGSGHQFFLETVRQLMDRVSVERVHATLFEAWTYPDEGLSMRWDPIEDRRYALMDRDPTASDNKPRTMWMANLLGYRALALFPCAPCNGRLRVTGWTDLDGEAVFTWPLWEFAAPPDTIRSLLALRELTSRHPDRAVLRARGVVASFRARRIKVGTGTNYKLNFSPARAV